MILPRRDLDHIVQQVQLWPKLRGKRIFLTGASGFVGTWLTESLAWANVNAELVPLPRTGLPEAGFDFGIHAANSDPRHTQQILNYAARSGVQRLLYTSSGAVYAGSTQPGYAQDKRVSERLCAESNVPTVIARLFAFTGPALPLDRNFAAGNFVRDAMAGGPIVIEGDGQARRSYLYAADLAIRLWTLLLEGQGIYDVGSPDAVSIRQLAAAVSAAAGGVPVITLGKAVPGAGSCYVPNHAMQPLISFSEGIQRMYDWNVSAKTKRNAAGPSNYHIGKMVRIGSSEVGAGQPSYIVAEIGINHNGDLNLARKLIDAASTAGCDAVKFQKRTVEIVYTRAELAAPRDNPFGKTNGDLKRALEFNLWEYAEIDTYCRRLGIPWFASCWDENSVDLMRRFDLPCFKIASASLTDDDLLTHTRAAGKPIILSTGMSTIAEVDHAVRLLDPEDLILLHACSTYPAHDDELNLRAIPTLQERYQLPVGYSGHETGLATTLATIALGACYIERHLTMDRGMWGTDHAASLDPPALQRLVLDIRSIERALGDGIKRVNAREYPVLKKLRRVGASALAV